MRINRKSSSSLRFAQKYSKNKATPILLVRADGIKCEPVIIFKGVFGKKIIDEGECLKNN